MKLVKAGEEGKQPLDHATAGLCELIRSHVQSVTGRYQQTSDYDDSDKAYASWIRETKSHFNIPDRVTMDPLIVLDTCEVLDETDCKHKMRTTMLESFCRAIPAPHKIFVIGCNARMQSVGLAATLANIDKMQPLQPLSEDAHMRAVVSWDRERKVGNLRLLVRHVCCSKRTSHFQAP